MSRIYSPEIFRKGDKILRVANTEKGWMFAGKDLIDVMGIETKNVAATIRKAVSVKNIDKITLAQANNTSSYLLVITPDGLAELERTVEHDHSDFLEWLEKEIIPTLNKKVEAQVINTDTKSKDVEQILAVNVEDVIKLHDDWVDGRSLHEFLQVKTDYNDWFPRQVEYGFTEGIDFHSKMSKSPSTLGRPSINHEITLDMAKHLAMIQRTPQGMIARQYFIDVEKKAREALKPMTQAEMIAAQANLLVEQERRQRELEARQTAIEAKQEAQGKEIATMKEIFCIRLDNWQDDCNKIIRYIGQRRGGGQDTYRDTWREVYEVFSARYHVDLPVRKKKWLKRMEAAGATKTAMKGLTFLTIIDSDPRLREGLITVVKEFAIKEGITMTADHEVIEFKVIKDQHENEH